MSVYHLTHTEAWALATALHLPVQPGSALIDWLQSDTPPVTDPLPASALDGLAAKGYYAGPQVAQPFAKGLIEALALTSVNAATITALLRTNGQASLTRFAQVGDGLVQYGTEGAQWALHDVAQVREMAQTLLPAWFAVTRDERLQDDLPLGAFLLFSHACVLADWAAARSDFEYEHFPTRQLLETFQQGAGWVDAFNATGVEGVPATETMPLDSYLNLLVTRGYLATTVQEHLEIGPTGRPLAAALSAPDRCTLTLTLQTWEETAALCGAFLHGSERLFLLEFFPGQVRIQQLSELEDGRTWVAALFERGKQAHYPEYIIPPETAGAPLQHIPAADGPSAGEMPAEAGNICPQCGTPLRPLARFCPNCGAQQSSAPEAVDTSAKTVMGIAVPPLARLTLLSGPLASQQFPVGNQVRLGREVDNDVRLPDEKASRYHALIQRQGDRYQITDLGSSNGTSVNGTRIAGTAPLADGDRILIGETQLLFNDQVPDR